MRLVHSVVRTAVDGDGSVAPWGFGGVHLPRGFKCARDLNPEVAQYRCARLRRVVVQKNVVAMSPQSWLGANEFPDLAQGRPPRRANREPYPKIGGFNRITGEIGDWPAT